MRRGRIERETEGGRERERGEILYIHVINIFIIYLFLSSDSLSGFKAALRHSQSFQRQRSTHSTSSDDWKGPPLPSYARQTSNQSDLFTVLSDHFSRISIEDIPVVAHPSPLPYRRNNDETLRDNSNNDDDGQNVSIYIERERE